MAKFCGKCGSPLSEGTRFCAKCGAAAGESTPVTPSAPTPAASPTPSSTSKRMSGLAKLAIAAVGIIFVGGGVAAAGMFYAAHRVSQEFQAMKDNLAGNTSKATSASSPDSDSRSIGDPCRYLSSQDVGKAIGVEIVATRAEGEACSYLAKGNEGDMAAKHAAAMMKAKGADEKTQKMFEQFGSAVFKSMPQEKQDAGSDASGNVPVLGLSVSDSPSAIAEMKLNAKTLKNLGGGSTGRDLDIGDQAFVSAESMIMVRKGGKVIRVMYVSCPCGTGDVIPLTKKVADSL